MHKRKKRNISLIISSIILITILSLIFGENIKNTQQTEKGQQKFFAILPHFTLQAKTIENFYIFLKETYDIKNQEILNIVLISPDHFNASKNNIDMLCKDTEKFCYKENCISAKALPSTKTSGCLNKATQEHGLGEQFRFIKKIFPKANIYPIVVKPRKFVEDTDLISTLSGYKFIGKTLVLASVDFSHYVDEDFAKLHDKKSLYTLNNAKNMSEYGSLEVDCPSCLYIANTLAQQNNQYPKLFLRDSSSSIM